MCHTGLLVFIFIAFRVLDSIMSDGRSKRVMELDGSEHPNFWDRRNVDISISSKKIKLYSLEIKAVQNVLTPGFVHQ
jgi:hypothetical protein